MLSTLPLPAQEQGNDQSWAQFSPENTLQATVTTAPQAAKQQGRFPVITRSGEAWTVFYGVNTRVMRDRQPIQPTTIQAGDMIFAAGDVNAKKKTIGAAILIDIPAAEVRKAREGLGKTWAAGTVSAIHGTRIEVKRMDGVLQSIAVDEDTSFRRKREPVTLMEVKPGDGFRAEGHVVNGVFTATTFTVFDVTGKEPWLNAGSGRP